MIQLNKIDKADIMIKLLKSLPVQLVICILFALFATDSFSPFMNQISFTLSYVIKECFLLVLPFVIFSYVTFGLTSFEGQGIVLLIVTLIMIVISNAFACLYSYGLGALTLPLITMKSFAVCTDSCNSIESLTTWSAPEFIKPLHAMLAAFALGIANGFIKNKKLNTLFLNMKNITEIGLKRILIPVLPLYVFGFLIKLKCEGQISTLLTSFGSTFIIICLGIVIYLFCLMIITSRMTRTPMSTLLKEIFAPAITGFSTMSSAATMPITMQALQKLAPHNKRFMNFILPTTSNVNLAADAISITLMCLTIALLKGENFIPFSQFLIYTGYYCLLKFSSAGIPGGGVLVLTPLFQSQLGLDYASTTLITTLYILQDPLLTASNVTGNTLFSLILEKLYSKWNLFKSKT